jgi:MYXO-CTERM domain-containing protein
VNVDYSARIAVQGGVPPYVCELDPATAINVPSAIVLNSNCELTGEVVDLPGAPQNQPFVVRVRDQLGSVAERSYTIRLVRGSAVTIETDRMDEAVAGMSYGNPSTGERPEKDNAGCVTARGGDQVYTWMLEGFSGRRRVPAGLNAQPVPIAEGRKIDGVTVQTMFCFSGTPTECGEFLLPVRVTDGDGQTDYADVPLNVRCAEIELTTRELAAVEANATVDVQLQAKPAEGVHFRLVGGRLPAGLELASDGRLHGTVAENAAAGVYSFLVDMKNDVGGRGRAALSIEVKPTKKELKKIPPEREKIGCGSSVAGNGLSGIAPFAVVLLGLMAAALRRRVAATARVGVRMLGGWGARPRG